MPYVVCLRCQTRSYVPRRGPRVPCPVCEHPLCADPDGRHDVSPLAARSDVELTRRAADGDSAAFTELHRRYHAPLLAQATRLVGRADADDVVQDTFERAHVFLTHDARALDPRTSLSAWLHTVMRRRAIDELRTRGRQTQLTDTEPASGTERPDQRYETADALSSTCQALLALPDRQRAALIAVAIDGHTHDHAAARLGCSTTATKGLVHRARLHLRHALAA